MLTDAYKNPLSTQSVTARDALDLGVKKFLGAEAGVADAFLSAIDADEGFALAHIGHAREMQLRGRREEVKASLGRARKLAQGLSAREKSHIHASGLLLEGKGRAAREAVYEHVDQWPLDVMIAQMCTSVFGLIGFSGLPGREAEQLAFNTRLASSYGDDWWCRAQLAFAQLEVGRLAEAETNIEAAMASNPESAHSAHIQAHLFYEKLQDENGLRFLSDWWANYDPEGTLHNHMSWHVGLWSLEAGDLEQMMSVLDGAISPDCSHGPPLNVLTDAVALMFRAELSGVEVSVERWRKLSAYALTWFPKTGLAFADAHAAIAHARSQNWVALDDLVNMGGGPAGEVTRKIAAGYRAMEDENWSKAADLFVEVVPEHARIGGSNAQRDLIDFTLAACLARDGRQQEARTILKITRPRALSIHAVAGL